MSELIPLPWQVITVAKEHFEMLAHFIDSVHLFSFNSVCRYSMEAYGLTNFLKQRSLTIAKQNWSANIQQGLISQDNYKLPRNISIWVSLCQSDGLFDYSPIPNFRHVYFWKQFSFKPSKIFFLKSTTLSSFSHLVSKMLYPEKLNELYLLPISYNALGHEQMSLWCLKVVSQVCVIKLLLFCLIALKDKWIL